MSVDAPGHLVSVLNANHTASNLLHILQEMGADVGGTELECEKRLIRNTVGVQRCATERRGSNVRLGIEAPFACLN